MEKLEDENSLNSKAEGYVLNSVFPNTGEKLRLGGITCEYRCESGRTRSAVDAVLFEHTGNR